MKSLRCLVFLVVFVWPAAARAQGGFWDFVEGGSGPGPFHGYTGEVRLTCVREVPPVAPATIPTHPVKQCLGDLDTDIKAVVNFSVGRYSSGDNPRFTSAPNDTATINMTKVESTFMYRVNPMLDVGVGGAFIQLSGSGFSSQPHPAITAISVTFTPLAYLQGTRAKWGRFLRFNFSDRVVFGEINAVDFNSPAVYRKGAEFQRDFSWGLDFGSLIWH